MRYEFNWLGFTKDDLKEMNEDDHRLYKNNLESRWFGCVELITKEAVYLIDIHYYYYGSRDQGIDLEVFKTNVNYGHEKWIGNITSIKYATHYMRFCHRAENLIISLIKGEE